jgi:predicted nucleotidyltransferase
MKKFLNHLIEHKRLELREIVDIITKEASPKMIILFGSYTRGTWMEKWGNWKKSARLLPDKQGAIDKVLKLLHDHHRVSLKCFEKDPAHFHRHVLGGYLEKTYSVEVCNL